MKNKLLIYDDNCPLCSWYSGLFVRYHFLPADGRVAFSTLEPGMLAKINFDRSRNEIPLIDTQSGEVVYGIDALLEILGSKMPWIKTTGRIRPVHYLLTRFYKLISFNRKVIVAKKCGAGTIDCSPDMNYFYRSCFLILFLIINSLMLYPIYNSILAKIDMVTISVDKLMMAHFILIGINCLLSLRFSAMKLMEYLGQANMLAVIAILLITPLLLAMQLIPIPVWIVMSYIAVEMIIIFREYIRRMEYLDVLKKHQWIASINFATMTGFVVALFI